MYYIHFKVVSKNSLSIIFTPEVKKIKSSRYVCPWRSSLMIHKSWKKFWITKKLFLFPEFHKIFSIHGILFFFQSFIPIILFSAHIFSRWLTCNRMENRKWNTRDNTLKGAEMIDCDAKVLSTHSIYTMVQRIPNAFMVPYRRNIYEPLNRTSSQIVRVAAVQEFWKK